MRLGCALVIAALAVACGEEQAAPPARRDPTPVRPAAEPDAAPSRGFVGVITAADLVDIAPRFEGVVTAVHVRAGDTVTAGQVLVEMDPRPMREELRAATAAYGAVLAARRQADVDVEEARRKLALEIKAVANGVSPRNNVDDAQFALRRAEAAAARAASTTAAESSHVQTARDHVADAALRAKFDGVVAMRFKDAGSTVAANTSILRIVGQREPRLRFAVPPETAGGFAPGDKVTATVETIANPVVAVIRQVSPALDPASGMIIVEAELAAGSVMAELRPGLPAWVQP